MVRREGGQALLLVLIILAIGTLMIVPALRLTQTSLKSIQIITRHNRGLYVAGAAQEMIMWMLYYGTLTDNMTTDGDKVSFSVDVCDAVVAATVTMRAVESTGGTILASEHTILPAKTVTPNTVPDRTSREYTYTISLEQVSSNNTQGLNVIYDVLPEDFGKQDVYQIGSSETSPDNINWTSIGEPSEDTSGQQLRLTWPASGNFTAPFRDFTAGQTKYLRFKIEHSLQNDDIVACNWVVLKVGDVYTLSGPQAPIVVGSPADPEGCVSDGLFAVYKESYPESIPPLQATEVTYTLHITNMDGNTRSIVQIDDFLPPGFDYEPYETDQTSGDIVIDPAYWNTDNVNGVVRQHLIWNQDQLGAAGAGLAAGENVTMVFNVLATQGVSGSYYNEVIITPKNVPEPAIFTSIDSDYDWSQAFGGTYSWNSGTVIVPAYDSETNSEGENVTVNFGLDPGGVTINSWVIK